MAKVGRPLAEPEAPDPRANCPRTDQGDLPSSVADALHLVRQRLHAHRVECPVGAGEDVGADLDDDGPRQSNDFLSDRIEHR